MPSAPHCPVFPKSNPWNQRVDMLPVAARVLTKSGRSTQTLDRYRCQSIGVRVDHEQKIELDGDIIGEARHVEVEVQPRALIVRTETGRAPA